MTPLGPAAFYLKGATRKDVTLSEIVGSIWLPMALQFVSPGRVIALPQIALWLPSIMSK